MTSMEDEGTKAPASMAFSHHGYLAIFRGKTLHIARQQCLANGDTMKSLPAPMVTANEIGYRIWMSMVNLYRATNHLWRLYIYKLTQRRLWA